MGNTPTHREIEEMQHNNHDLSTAPCTENFTFKIPECTKAMLDRLSPEFKKLLVKELRKATAYVLHQAIFDASVYLNDE